VKNLLMKDFLLPAENKKIDLGFGGFGG